MYRAFNLFNFVKGLFPGVSETHCGYNSLQEYVITIVYQITIGQRLHQIHIYKDIDWVYLLVVTTHFDIP